MKKACRSCSNVFEITDDDLAFYERVSPVFNGRKELIPHPTLCPECRLQRRLAFRCPLSVFIRPGYPDGKQIFSMFPPSSAFPVMPNKYWHGDEWNPSAFSEEISWEQPFLEQFKAFTGRVPQPALAAFNNENCDYCNNLSDNRNCYLVFNTSNAEDCMYCDNAWDSKDCIECTMTMQSQLCYDCTYCIRCYKLQSSEYSEDCSESAFLVFCRSCKHCFGCVNLRRKEYCIFNEQKTKEEYETFMKSFDSTSWSAREVFRNRMEEMAFQHPRPHAILRHTEDVSGNFLQQAKNVRESMFIQYAEDCLRCFNVHEGVRDCRDYTLFGRRAELIYESASCGIDIQRLAFCYQCREGSNSLYYCSSCDACQDCFGSISLRHKRYCIFNRQYTKDEYEQTVPKLIEKMRREGAWGEMFPMDLSPIPYNHSYAQRYFPLTKRQALERGLGWYDKEVEDAKQAVNAGALPDQLPSASEPILARSVSSGRPYRITTKEMEKYHQLGVPLPRYTYDERMELRAKKLGGIRLYERTCMKTGKPILTTYAPDSPYIIWDRDIYEEESVS